jgi:lipopolysaccharide export system protein LptA
VQKLRLLFILLICPFVLLAQTRTQIKLEAAEKADIDAKKSISYLRKPVFSHEGAILRCDSAVLYVDRNYFEAFRNVHINQGDTLNIYSDLLNYDGNAKKAHLEKNVKLLDRENTLTTDILDYDMVAKIGKYTTGGKLVNKDATITSTEGYYFSNSRDAFFKVNVRVVTAEKTTITSEETLRYNTASNWTYFYGPTNIKNKDDKLYTEDGSYNTKSENAMFGKKNLYTNGSRSLKGDSLYYYGKTGYGKAVKNIVFKDTKDQTTLWGQLGEYYRNEERIVVTQKAYVGIGTKDSITVKNKKIPDTLWLGADTLESQRSLVKDLKLLTRPAVKKDNEIGAEDEKEKAEKEKEKAEARKLLAQSAVAPKDNKKSAGSDTKLSKKEQKQLDEEANKANKDSSPLAPPDSLALSKLKLKQDSLTADSLLKLKKIAEPVKMESIKNAAQQKLMAGGNKAKSTTPASNTLLAKNAGNLATSKLSADSNKLTPADTVKARVIKAFHNVRVYKSNMQAKADSLYYTSADSTLRWYNNPILWSDGTQQTGDTINVFFKNSKIHNFQVINNGFIVNVDGDSTKFNQVKGKIITGFFADGELRNMYVDGNAESIYYSKNNKGEYDNVNQTVSSRLRFKFLEKELTHIVTVREVEGAVDPIDKLSKEPLLTGFIWKPELRPLSKADIIKGIAIKPKAKTPTKSTTTKKGAPATAKNAKVANKAVTKDAPKPEKAPMPLPEFPKLNPKPNDTTKLDSLIKKN